MFAPKAELTNRSIVVLIPNPALHAGRGQQPTVAPPRPTIMPHDHPLVMPQVTAIDGPARHPQTRGDRQRAARWVSLASGGAVMHAVTPNCRVPRTDDELLGGGDDDVACVMLASPQGAGQRVLVRAEQGELDRGPDSL